MKPYCDTAETVKKAREYIENQPGNGTFNDKSQSKKDTACSSSGAEASPLTVNDSPVLEPSKSTSKTGYTTSSSLQNGSNLIQSTLFAHSKTSCKDKDLSNASSTMQSLHDKVDTLINDFKEFRLKSSPNFVHFNTSLAAIDGKLANEVAYMLLHWTDVKNILDLVQLCKNIRFFTGDANQGACSVLRCETCFNFIMSKRPKSSKMQSPSEVAKRGLGGYAYITSCVHACMYVCCMLLASLY